ncbi:indoleamine 2,3-dioxygenase [Cordyceps fumosorosea ARSEF 2679]|uniref:Indoleamine 2,3-dioxygenase n=1 Tax=Cordyceps fumosorosea (strain ARSEF 2679) TaxID=1081104 RepID=A0A167GVW1_CORFA|nr:indoleamine 2,3-dioxygenase [Cordyceps fumosorosea ARSEF 2679]OAA47167.1 indoleamine 2,3-dioxygenase [Cordyceps fumosorosea ARSEF 2679]
MLPPIPSLDDYGLSTAHGFLPNELPLARLPDPYYNKWEAIAANLPALILSRRLRGVIDRLHVLDTIGLEHDAEWRRAYSILCFMTHGYVWAGDSPADRIPPQISIPLLAISHRLDILPVATYAAVCLWNFKPLFMNEDIDNLENLASLNTFTGSIDESWFYLVSVAIEARGAPMLDLGLTAMEAARLDNRALVISCLCAFAERLTDLTSLLQRMHENCDPTVFYNRIRPYLAGSKNMGEAGLPHGVIYEDGSGAEEHRQYSGGSNAQSSLIQFFDILLGIKHHPTGQSVPTSEATARRNNFIQDMRRYMPARHAEFLTDCENVANIRSYVESNTDDEKLCLSYDACLAMLSAFRDKHIAIVTRYIINPSREVRARSRSPEAVRGRNNIAIASRRGDGKLQKGTGGTALIPFLKQARDETGAPAIAEWTRRFMKRQVKPSGQSDLFAARQDEVTVMRTDEIPIRGLAQTWTMEDEVGGICQF